MDVLELSPDQLGSLADILRRTESGIVLNRNYESEIETRQQLDAIEGAYQAAVQLLAKGASLDAQYAGTPKADAAHQVFEYIKGSTNFGLQNVRNFYLRSNYLSKIAGHAQDLQDAIQALDVNDAADMQVYAQQAATYRNAVLEMTRLQQTPSSRAFSEMLKEQGVDFDTLIDRYKVRRGYDGPFEELAPEVKVEVYGDIIAASGRGNTIITNLSKGLGATGIVVLLATAAIVVWDVVASAHPVQAAVGDAVQLAAGVGGAYLGDVLATAAAAGLDASPGFIFLAGVAGAIAGAVLIGAFVASLVDEIFSSGKSTLSMAGYQVYVAPLPDGRELASRLVHS